MFDDDLNGWPQTRNSGFTPAGEIEQIRKIGRGLRAKRAGWRRVVVAIGMPFFLLIVVTSVVLTIMGLASMFSDPPPAEPMPTEAPFETP